MSNSNRYNHYQRIILAVVMTLGITTSGVMAADAAGKTLPAHENCQSAAYISVQWNANTRKSNRNDVLAYKKLICKSGREAFILVQADKSEFNYWLIDHYDRKISPETSNVCPIVDKYCSK